MKYKSDFLNEISSRGFIYQASDIDDFDNSTLHPCGGADDESLKLSAPLPWFVTVKVAMPLSPGWIFGNNELTKESDASWDCPNTTLISLVHLTELPSLPCISIIDSEPASEESSGLTFRLNVFCKEKNAWKN